MLISHSSLLLFVTGAAVLLTLSAGALDTGGPLGSFPSWALWQEPCATSLPLPWEFLLCWLLPRWPFNL